MNTPSYFDQSTPFHNICDTEVIDTEFLKYLIENGANLNQMNTRGYTSIYYIVDKEKINLNNLKVIKK
jgi:hypothetical protein